MRNTDAVIGVICGLAFLSGCVWWSEVDLRRDDEEIEAKKTECLTAINSIGDPAIRHQMLTEYRKTVNR